MVAKEERKEEVLIPKVEANMMKQTFSQPTQPLVPVESIPDTTMRKVQTQANENTEQKMMH